MIRMVLFEAALISAIAGMLGYVVGLVTTKLTIPLFTESVGVKVPFDPLMAGTVFTAAVLLGLAASAYPALLAGNLDPNQALRSL